jgi:hypothetical protein
MHLLPRRVADLLVGRFPGRHLVGQVVAHGLDGFVQLLQALEHRVGESIEIGLRIGQSTELHVNPNIASNDGHASQVRGRVVDGRAPEDSTHGMSHRRPRGSKRLHRRCPEANAASELLPRVVEPDDRRQHAPRLEEDPAQEEDQRRFRHSPAA